MKIVICGDSHIGAVFGLGESNGKGSNTRIDDYEKTLNNIVTYCIDNNSDVFIQTGDIFDSRSPSPDLIDIVNRAVSRLSDAGIASFIIMGNHDYIKSGGTFKSSITSISEYPNSRAVINPEVVKVTKVDSEFVNILLMPYRDRRMYDGKTTKEDSILFDEHMNSLVKDLKGPKIAVGHNFFYEGSYHDYGGTEILSNPNSIDVDFIAMGHYHTFRPIKKSNPTAIYTGSMEKLNYGDKDIDKFFFEYDTVTKKVAVIKSNVRELEDISIDLSSHEYPEFWENFDSSLTNYNLKDKIVKIKLKVRSNIMHLLKKQEITNKLKSQGAFYVSKIIFEPMIFKVIKDDIILSHKNDADMISAFLAQQELDKDLKQRLIETAKTIIGEVNEANSTKN